MNTFTMKTFADSYLYNTKVSRNGKSDPAKDTNRIIKNFITTSHRVVKDSDSFTGVIEDIKRQQTSSVLLSILYNSNVVLCIADNPLPRAFTVIDAHDPKDNGASKVFIDVTGRIAYENGYYYIRRGEVDKICALLFNALVYMLYRYYPNKIVGNTNIASLAATCYTNMFTNIIDYLGVIGYSENKTKIGYLTALFFLNNLMGYELNDYNKTLAGKIVGITPREVKAYDLLISDDDMFDDINEFLNTVIDTFKLRGLTLQTFVSQWMRRFGTGMEYGIELYTSFLSMIASAYTGSYIVNQRQIEMACTSVNLSKLSNTILKVGADCFDLRYSMSESALEEFNTIHSKNTMDLAKSMKIREKLEATRPVVKDFSSIENVIKEAKELESEYKAAILEAKFGNVVSRSICNGIEAAYNNCFDILEGKDSSYTDGALTALVETYKNKCSNTDRNGIISMLNRDATHLSEVVRESGAPKEIREVINKTIIEFRRIQNYI